jgi:hypothetical protein
MTYIPIPTSEFGTTCTLSRRSTVLDSVGAKTETWTTLASGIKCIIQPLSVSQNRGTRGTEFLATHVAFINHTDVQAYSPKENDRLTDGNGTEYDVVEIKKYAVPTGEHHSEFILQAVKEQS